jgi:hypothetical protein
VWLGNNGDLRGCSREERQPESVLLLRKGNGAAVMKKRMVLGVLPAIGVSAIPTLACPAMPAGAHVSIGCDWADILDPQGIPPVGNLAALMLALTILFMKRRANGYAPFLLGATGAVAIMLGKFVFTENAVAWSGFAVLIVASALATLGRRDATICKVCDNKNPVGIGEDEYGKAKS